jgi:hypothetical protein
MAEVAIPILALGGLYIASNKKTEQTRSKALENFQNDNKSNPLKPTQVANQHVAKQPTTNNMLNVNQEFINPNDARDKYYQKKTGLVEIQKTQPQNDNVSEFVSLTGRNVDVANFKHNNMQPFFGSKVKGKYGDENSESVLDSLLGMGSQQREKEERGPLFKPEGGAKYINGAPNNNDFLRSRVNASLKHSNTKPWEEQRVAPGLNKGYTTEGGDGFNNGMDQRDLWQPKDVNELRVKNNPKMTYDLIGLEGPAMSRIQEMGTLGKVEKHKPDTFFINSQDKWMPKKSAAYTKQMGHAKHIEKEQSRTETTTDYIGGMANGSGNGNSTYAPQNYEDPHRQQLGSQGILGGVHMNKNAGLGEKHSSDSFNILNNNRSTVKQPESTGFMGGIIGSIMSPFFDVMRPSRKENVLKNLRECGSVNGANKSVYVKEGFKAAPTLREINGEKQHLNIQGQAGDAYQVTEHQRVFNQRETTNASNYGNVGGSVTGLAASSQEAYGNQHDNPYKETTTYNRFEHGAGGYFNNSVNVKVNKFESDRNNNRMYVPTTGPQTSLGVENVSQTTKYPQIGGVGQTQRLDGDILKAFKENPYTHSLSSAP